jgi:RNA polymerase sigma-70 factor (ECF subfamily)
VATCAIPATEANVIASTSIKGRDDSQINLVKRAQSGDEQAFATLFQQHKNRVYSVCLLMTKDVAEAEDLTQEAFLQVFRTVSSFRGDAAFSTWLYRVAVNTVLMKLRRRKSPPTVSLDEPVNPESPSLHRDFGKNDPELSGVVDRIALRRALDELPEGCRTIFALHEVEGYQHHEIAQLLDCSIGNSKSQLHKAKLKMLCCSQRRRFVGAQQSPRLRSWPLRPQDNFDPSAWAPGSPGSGFEWQRRSS